MTMLQVLHTELQKRLGLAVLTAMLVSQLPSARAAIFVKIPDVPGDVLVDGYNDGSWFAVESGSYGADRDLFVFGNAGTEDLNIGIGELKPLGLAGHFERAALPLIQASINGNSIGDVEIHLVEFNQEPGEGDASVTTFSIIKLTRAFVRSFTTNSGDGNRPWYQFKLIYNTIEVTNRHANPPGQGGFTSLTTTWNLVTNTGGYTDGSEPNQEPTISGIEPIISFAEDGTLTVPFTVADPDGPAADLSVAGTSSNQLLLPDSRITVTGSGSSRSLTLAPALNQHGSAIVTVVVSDLDSSASTSFDLRVTPEADPPAIATIGYRVGDADTPLTIPIDARDPDQGADSLILAASSSDPELFAEIVFAYNDIEWEMTIVPVGGRSGSADVTVTVTDDTGRRAATTFLIAVNTPSNTAPTDILLTPDVIPENSPPGLIGTLEAIDPDPDEVFSFELLGDAAGRFQLEGNQIFSTAEFDYESRPFDAIVVRATDREGAAFSKAVVIGIENVNEPPEVTLDLPPTIPPAAPPGVPIPYPNIAFSDPDAGASDVRVTLSVFHGALSLDDSGVLFGKVEGNGTSVVTVTAVIFDINQVLAARGLTYAADLGYVGVDSLSATIDDNGNTGSGEPISASASDEFFVPREPLRDWLDEVFTPAELEDPAISGLLADGEGDGLTTLLEYKLGKDPRDPTDPSTNIELSQVVEDGTLFMQLSFIQRTDASDPNTILTVETASALSGWNSGPAVTHIVSRVPLGDDLERVTVRAPVRTTDQRQFMRLKVDYFGPVDPF